MSPNTPSPPNPVADPGFPSRRRQPLNLGQKPIICKIFAENSIKMKEIGPREGAHTMIIRDQGIRVVCPRKRGRRISKGPFTLTESELEKDKRTSEGDQRKKFQSSKKIFAFARCEWALTLRKKSPCDFETLGSGRHYVTLSPISG